MRTFILQLMAMSMVTGVAVAQPASPAAPVPPAFSFAYAQAAPTAPAKPAQPAAPATPALPAGRGTSYLGVDTRDVTHERMADLKLNEDRGVEVVMVDQDAPAGKAGLHEHDVILTYNGEKVDNVDELRRLIRDTTPGTTVSLGIRRDGQPMMLRATLADRRRLGAGPVIRIP